MNLTEEEFHKELIRRMDLKSFATPSEQDISDNHFPDFLKEKLYEWLAYYDAQLRPLIDDSSMWPNNQKDVLYNRLKNLIDGIITAVENYYSGKILEASKIFNSAIEENIFKFRGMPHTSSIGPNFIFYRARVKEERKRFTKTDLFHVPYEKRVHVTTKRYSIPGLPALYFGDSAYVCWEEFNQHYINELWFSRFQNQKTVNVIELLRYEDFKRDIFDKLLFNIPNKNGFLFRYIVNFPLNFACTIRVKESDGVFKPEYIIPQLLLQYVSNTNDVWGIKYPSTKVDYSKLTSVPAYNYVFPVKKIKNKGFCDDLASVFHMTEPTSLDWEKIKYNPRTQQTYITSGFNDYKEYIEFIDGEKSPYLQTSFGHIEQVLRHQDKKISPVI